MVEIWKDIGVVAAHHASEHLTSFVVKAKSYLTPPLEVKVFSGKEINIRR